MTDTKVLARDSVTGGLKETDLQPTFDGKTNLLGFPTDASGAYLCSLSYNESTRTVTVTPTGVSFDVYLDGVAYTFTGPQSIAHGTAQGVHFVYYDETGTLVTGQTSWDLLKHAPVCYIFRDAISNLNIAWEERHHAGRDPYWHRNQHFNEGTKVRSGFALAGYVLNSSTSNAAITYSVGPGTVDDEDISVVTETVADGGPYTIMSRTGVAGDWVINRTRILPFLQSGLDIAYNSSAGGNWALTGLGQNQYVNYYVLAATALASSNVTPASKNQILIIPGQVAHTSLANATAEQVSSLSWGSIPFQEVAAVYKVTMVRNTSYGTTGRCRIAAVNRIIGAYAQITAAPASSHGALSGLLDDNHPQYPLLSSGAGAPATVPARIGALYVDTSEPCLYAAKGDASAADWFVSPSAKVTVFSTSGDFTLKASTQAVRVILAGAGGGGGSGAVAAESTNCTGGAGGGGASVSEVVLTRAETLAAYPTGVVPVVVGAPGAAGAAVTSAGNANGNAGGIGGTTTFGTLAKAYGGGGGGPGYGTATVASVGGTSASIRAAGLTASTNNWFGRSPGGNGASGTSSSGVGTGAGGAGCATTGVAASGVFAALGGQGGGAGGGVDPTNTPFAGGTGGLRWWETSIGNAGAAGGTAGGAGADPLPGQPAGQGGGGGGGSISGNGGPGGAGGIGSGGGGGGACKAGFTSGAGGLGGPGRAIIVEY